MGMLEFHLARLTAQSKRSNPKLPFGGRPEITVEDVRAALASSNPWEYVAVASRVCQCERATIKLLDMTRALSLRAWYLRPDNYRTRASLEQLDLMAEAAVLAFLSPLDGDEQKLDDGARVRRDETWAARYCKIAPKIFAANYRDHWRRMISVLDDFYRSGARRICSNLTKSPETLDLP